jgi:uncharacterized protein YndB with AHSA1/START domain
MAAKSSTAANPVDPELVIMRIFDAPRGLVWKARSEPERMAQWAGPKGFTMTSCEMGTRPGEAFHMSMRSPDSAEHRVRGVYHEIEEGERLVYTWAWVEAEGKPGHETLITVTFADYGERTKLTLHQAIFESVTARNNHPGGWRSALDCLAEYLAAL